MEILSLRVFFSSSQQRGNTWLDVKVFHKCGHLKRRPCNFALVTKRFNLSSKPKLASFTINSYINCNLKNIVYVIKCIRCDLHYVGCTSDALKIHIRRHLSDISSPKTLNLSAASRHFTTVQGDVSHFRFMGVEKVMHHTRGSDLRNLMLMRKAFWI